MSGQNMRWGIYCRDGFEGAEAFRDGLAKVGSTGDLRSVSDYAAGDVEKFDAIALWGLQGKGPLVLKEYEARGIPVHVIDYGYMRRTNHAHDWRTGHWQISRGGLNRLPDFECDDSRFKALGVTIAESGGDPNGYVLLCVQTTGDASHGMEEAQLQQWCDAQRARWPDLQVRPHPLQSHLDYGLPRCTAKTLDAALAGARLVVTGNSNTGNDALMAGVPVVATIHGAAWADLSGAHLPSLGARQHHFNRCAWAQWTWDEMRQGLPQRILQTSLEQQ